MRKIITVVKSFRKFFFTFLVKLMCPNRKGKVVANFYSKIGRNTFLGDNVNFNGMEISSGGKVYIGSNFHSGKQCMIIVQSHNYEGKTIPYDTSYINKDVEIGDNVWLGHRVIILGGVKIGEGAIIQAGAVVVSDIPDCGIAGGNPAKVFKFRNKEHYYKLKEENKTH
nr:acyltransferase [uncultured Sphingobacterium sp.]